MQRGASYAFDARRPTGSRTEANPIPASEPTLYDPATEDRVRRAERTVRLVAFGAAVLAAAVLVAAAHHELPFLAYWTGACPPDAYAYECPARTRYDLLAGIATTLLLGLPCLWLLRVARFPPTVRCTGCGTAGWVLDLEPHAGRCPRCGGERFDYRAWIGGAGVAGPRIERVVELGVRGEELVRRSRATRRSWAHRVY